MNWSLLVPGALLPPALAPELTRVLHAPALAAQLALARPQPPAGRAAGGDGLAATHAPHWQWLAQRLGLDPANLATAPYAWRAAGGDATHGGRNRAGGAEDAGTWVAHCEPVHMAIARDHFVVTDLAAAPLDAEETRELLDLANAVLAAESPGAPGTDGPRLRLDVREGRWFLLSPRPLQLAAWSLDAVLGRSVQDRLPVGADARRWRLLGNEIQMSWHASRASAAREEAGVRVANALWLHGGGVWRALAPLAPLELLADDAPAEAAALRGWMLAAGAQGSDARAGGTLSICRVLFDAHAHQAWESWLAQVPALEARLASDLDAARRAGATRFDLVLCGNATSRTLTLPLHAPWWRRLRLATPAPAALLQRWLTEETGVAAHPGRGMRGPLAA